MAHATMTSIIAELFYNANVCVSPGNVGLTAIHSLTFGCPVITHGNLPDQMPEFEAIRPGITGDFFKENDAYDLSEKIKKWISLNDAQRDETRNAAYKEIDQKWNIHYQINTIRKIINEIN
jgi:glycosyltransferase involved in cell wall biosynthesis